MDEPDKSMQRIGVDFDMIHVTPPQSGPDLIAVSPLADVAGSVEVDQATLRHKRYQSIWSLGDVKKAPTAKVAAAARKEAPVVANEFIADIRSRAPLSQYDGYGACSLTLEWGKIVIGEFGYGGILQPSCPRWLIDGTQPRSLAWLLEEKGLPPVYWKAMLKGREWLAKPEHLKARA